MQKVLTIITNLRDIREHPPSLNVSVGSEIVDSLDVRTSHTESKNEIDTNIDANNIDWDISVDGSQIDWDIGTVEDTEDYEIINANEIFQNSATNDNAESHQNPSNEGTHGLLAQMSWDVSVETPKVDVIDDAGLLNVGSDNQIHVFQNSMETGTKEDRSRLLETEYRNKILDDLFEVHATLYCENIWFNLFFLYSKFIICRENILMWSCAMLLVWCTFYYHITLIHHLFLAK